MHNKLVHISIHERPSLSKVKHASEKEDEENAPFESKATPSTSAHHDPDVIVSPDVAEQLRTFLSVLLNFLFSILCSPVTVHR